MFSLLKKVRPGAPIRADDINDIVAALNKALQVRAGAGVSATWDQNAGLSIALVGVGTEWLVPARITRVYGNNPDLANNVRYDATPIGQGPESRLTNVLPAFGRQVKGSEAAIARVRPAAEGSFCWILRDRDSAGAIVPKLVLLSGGTEGETLFHEACT